MPSIQITFTDVDDFLKFMEQMKEAGKKLGIEIEVRQIKLINEKHQKSKR